MAQARKPTTQDLIRLDAIAKHLGIKSRFPAPNFTAEVTAACISRIKLVVDELEPSGGEAIATGLGDHFQLIFEEVYGPNDVATLEQRYLKEKKELGFAQIRQELSEPGVDALLFQRMRAKEHEPDRWVAVLNLQETDAKAYWNRFHELAHRIAEPPQQILPFRRHQLESNSPVEILIDAVAAEIAFYAPIFSPLVLKYAKTRRLSMDLIDVIREEYAPTASLLSTMNAVIKHWPRSAIAITAQLRGRRNAPSVDQALRVAPQSSNDSAIASGLRIFPNMRAPQGTPIHNAYASGTFHDAVENLSGWTTSEGDCLRNVNVFTSARMVKDRVYAVMSV